MRTTLLTTKSLVRFSSLAVLGASFVVHPFASQAEQKSSNPSQAFEQQVIDVIMRHPDVLIRSVELYQERQKQERSQRAQNLARALQNDASRYVSGSPIFGSRSAKVYLYVFADFQCPFCAQVSGVLGNFVTSNPDVALVYKNYPIVSIHPEAMNAAAAAWAAEQQGLFWAYHDILYANQSQINEALLLNAAKELKLDLNRFNRDRKSKEALASIKADMELADSLGISGTPFFVMNGEIFSGAVNAESLKTRL